MIYISPVSFLNGPFTFIYVRVISVVIFNYTVEDFCVHGKLMVVLIIMIK